MTHLDDVRVLKSTEGQADLKELALILERQGSSSYRWSNQAGDEYQAHRHTFHKVLLVEQGSITFHLPELDRSIELGVGDRLELPAGILHAATVGLDGVVCLEAGRIAVDLNSCRVPYVDVQHLGERHRHTNSRHYRCISRPTAPNTASDGGPPNRPFGVDPSPWPDLSVGWAN
jgi:quercetin dioxygenase-like cupin family protein